MRSTTEQAMLAITSWFGGAIPFHVLCSVDNDRDGGRRGGGGKGVFEKGKGRGVMKDERGRGGGRGEIPNAEFRMANGALMSAAWGSSVPTVS
jgi:hypothetical protein